MVAILTPIYDAEFLGFSYGFRPKRSQHDALDALALVQANVVYDLLFCLNIGAMDKMYRSDEC
jgi:hypothetical protein